MAGNKINTSYEIVDGKRFDWRQNLWDSRYHALTNITGIQRIQGLRIPCKVGRVYADHWFVGGFEDKDFVIADNQVNQDDGLIYAGTTFDDTTDPKTVALNGSQWRSSDILHTIQAPTTYEIPTAHATLLRQDMVVGDPDGHPHYLEGTPGETAVAPTIPEGYVMITSFIVSLADGVVEVPAPIQSKDGEMLYGLEEPVSSQGKSGDSYKVTEGPNKGNEYKKKTVNGVVAWFLEFTPDAAGNTFAGLTDAPEDNALLDAALDGKVDKVVGKSLIDDTEIARLAGVSNKFDGTFISLAALEAAFPTSGEGHEALVDAGSGTDAVKYIYDQEEGWIAGGGAGASSFADLTGSPTDNTALAAALAAREPVITGTSAVDFWSGAKTFLNFATTLFASVLPTLTAGANTPIVAGISLKSALQNLQAQITALASGGASKPIQLFSEVLTTGGWSLVSGYYEYTYTNASITVKSIVDFTPVNASVETVKSAEILPLTVSAAGSCKLYSVYLPLANITVNVTITESL